MQMLHSEEYFYFLKPDIKNSQITHLIFPETPLSNVIMLVGNYYVYAFVY